jgi:hypothetical protein
LSAPYEPDCQYAEDDNPSGWKCTQCDQVASTRKHYPSMPPPRNCKVHPRYARPEPDEEVPAKSRGLGDTIAKITKALGIKPCGGCKKRQAALNKLVPYKEADHAADQ